MLKVHDDAASFPPVLMRLELPVRWGDMDADGHVNNTVLLRYVEEARMQWAASLDLPNRYPGLTPVVGELACRYHASIHYPVRLYVDLGCSSLGNSSLKLVFRILDAGPESTHYASACVTWIWTDTSTGRSSPMPQSLREVCMDADTSS